MKVNAEIFSKAIIFASTKHNGQYRKGSGDPYIVHPLGVWDILSNVKQSNNKYLLATVCMLHDVVEDCDVSLQEIAENFGYNVASIVEELTSDKEKIKEIGKKEYLSQKMINMSTYALCVKLSDRLYNMLDTDKMSDSFKTKYKDETTFILDNIENNRKLTKSHKKLIKLIRKTL